MNKIKLNKQYWKACTDYIRTFEKIHGIEVNLIGDFVGAVEFSDIYCDFSDLKFSVDNNLDFDFIANWHYYYLENHEIAPINFKSYTKLRQDFMAKKGFGFNELEFENSLLKMALRSKMK